MPLQSALRPLPTLAVLLLAAVGARTAHAQQVACDPRPILPEVSVPGGAFDGQVRQMLQQQEDFQKPACEFNTPRAQRVQRLLRPLALATRDIGASTRFLVLNKNEENAFATGWPDQGYHLIVVYTGIIEALDRRAAQSASRAGKTSADLGDTFLATVMAHEMSHLLLRHAQDKNCRGSNNLASGDAAATRAEGTRGMAAGAVACKSYSQNKELAADSLAAYLMFATRKNMVFSDAGDLVRLWELDAEEERASGENQFFGERVMSTHPSAVRRAAMYMRLWANMLEEQDRYDSAIGLISANVEVDRAIAMLDSVKRALPNAPFVEDAAGAALLTQWLSTVPVGVLGVRPTVGVVRTRFVEGLRGDNAMGDQMLMSRARTALESISNIDGRPASLANLALMDAYTGNSARALHRARRAVQLAPSDAAFLNTLGVAYYQAGQADSARAVFGRIISGSTTPLTEVTFRSNCLSQRTAPMTTRVCFNYARAVFEKDRTLGTALLSAYRDGYGQSLWGQEAGRVVFAARNGGAVTPASGGSSAGSTMGGSTGGTPAGGTAPSSGGSSRPKDPAPAAPTGASSKIGNLGFRAIQLVSPDGLTRVATGMRPRDARGALPAVVADDGSASGQTLASEEAGVALLVQPDPAGGQRVVGIKSSGRWSLAGVTPGQPVATLARLGRPVDHDGSTYVYVITGHLVTVATDGTTVRSVTVRADQ